MEDVCDLPFNPDEIFTVETLDDTEILIEHTLSLLILGQENPDEVLNGDVLLELESFLFDGNSAESTKGDLYQDPPIGQTVPAIGLEEMEFEESNLGLNLDVDLQYVPTFSESVDGDEDVFSKYDYRDLVNIQQLDFELFEAQRQKGPTFDDVLVEDDVDQESNMQTSHLLEAIKANIEYTDALKTFLGELYERKFELEKRQNVLKEEILNLKASQDEQRKSVSVKRKAKEEVVANSSRGKEIAPEWKESKPRGRRMKTKTAIDDVETLERYEDRERRREELKAEKREMKMEERRRELESWGDQCSPTEDLSFMDQKPLPVIPRLSNLNLSGQALADILMVYEFLHTFGETLGFDMESLPSLDSLQRALLYDSEVEEELLSVMTQLLVCCVEDPGIRHPNTTILEQTLNNSDVTTVNVNEILRIYLQANGSGYMKMLAAGEYPDTEAFLMSEWLKLKSFLSLNPIQKSAILGYMVNTLLQNKAVIGQIKGTIRGQKMARRDRRIVDMKIGKLKTILNPSISFSSTAANKADPMDNSATHDETNRSASGSKNKDEITETEDHHPEEADEESEGEADDNADQGAEDEDINLPVEELKKKIECLGRQSAQRLTELILAKFQLRAVNMGQDRFQRRLWVLPHAGGVYLEAVESGEGNAGPLGTWDGNPAPQIGSRRNGDEPMPEVPPVKNEPISDEPKPTLPVPKIELEDKETPSLQEAMEVDQPAVKTELVEEATTATAVKSEKNTTAGPIRPVTAEAVLKKEEASIPEEMTRGWWRIVDPVQLNTYVESLNPRGVREKELSHNLTRFMDLSRESCLKNKVASKKSANLEPRISESESTSATKEATEKSAHSNDSEAPVAVVAGSGPSTPVATPSSPRRSSSAVALKRRLNQAIAKEKNIAPCREILDQLEAHDEAWPFLLPVNTKQFPTYKKIIRSPMDLSTIRKKLTNGIYKTRDEFSADVQLMFVNCVTFNGDDSPVGKAGHSIKTFFYSRWAELIAH